MEFDLRQLAVRDRTKLLTAVVVPRPIALTVTLNADGQINAAPFSFFNLMGYDPPIIALGPGDYSPARPKDTVRNIRRGGEFVVNIVDEALAERMNVCAIEFSHDVDELAEAGHTSLPSTVVAVPRIAESPVSLECREVMTLEVKRTRVVLGEVLHLHIRDDLVDTERLYVQSERLGAIGRMHGSGWYARTTDLFQMPRMTPEEWEEKKKG